MGFRPGKFWLVILNFFLLNLLTNFFFLFLARDDVGESWKYSLRPCTESVFNALFHEFRDTLAPVLLNLIIQNNQLVINPQDMDAILRKDAIYNAVGLAAFDLYDEVRKSKNFEKF